VFDAFIKKNKLTDAFIDLAVSKFVPLAEKIVANQLLQKSPFFVAINGCQGSGKSTLADFICEYIKDKYKLNVIVMSLDDFYYSQQKRAELAAEVHPLLATRGVPGTHNTEHIKQLLQQAKTKTGSLSLPRFNKATDNPFPPSSWPVVDLPVDIVLFEGWCWGVYPQSQEQLAEPINELERDGDKNGEWRNYVNQCLHNNYVLLYEYMDYWVLLKAPSFDCVYQWRLEQESKLRLKNGQTDNSNIMSDSEIRKFIKFYQRLTEHGLATMADFCDFVFTLDSKRKITRTIIKELVA
jgi:D-glycerate 3-kinase